MIVFENTFPIPYAYASSPLLLVGGIKSMIDLIGTTQFNPFNRSAILSEQLGTPQLRSFLMNTNTVVFAQNKTFEDLALQLEDNRFSYPAQYTIRTKPDQFWSVLSDDQLFFYVRQFSQKLPKPYVLEADYLFGGVAAGTSAKNVSMGYDIPVDSTGSYDIWIRSMMSPIGGNFSVLLDGHPLNTFHTMANMAYMSWEKAGTTTLTKGAHHISLENQDGSNIVNVVGVVPSSELEGTRSWIADRLKTKNTFTLLNNGNATLLWNPTIQAPANSTSLGLDTPPAEVLGIRMNGAGEYTIQVHANRPYFLTISEVFNSGWNTVGVNSILAPSFGLMNGFYLAPIGSYHIIMKYAFNSYYQIGVWPTIGTLLGFPLVIFRKTLGGKAKLVTKIVSSRLSKLWS
jgi:hypothetical protein